MNDDLYAELRQRFGHSEQPALQQAATGVERSELTSFYERLLEEQSGRIADLQAALEHERRQTRLLSQALADVEQRLQTYKPPPKVGLLTRWLHPGKRPH